MRFQRLDLNLLVALDALLNEKSVSLAADRLCLSQSATSSALGRLREYFDDELLVRRGRSMVPTTRGQELVEPVRNVLDQIQSSIAVSPEFDPAISERTLAIMTSDYSTEVLLTEAFAHFEIIAPNMTFRILNVGEHINPVEELNRGDTDLIITLSELCVDEHPHQELFSDDYVVLGSADNPHFSATIDLDTYLRLGHIVTDYGNRRVPTFEGWILQQNQLKRNVEVFVPNFLAVPMLLAGTQRIATVHRRLARRFTSWLPLKAVEAPFEIPNLSISASWHRSAKNDPCTKWLVQHLVEIAAKKEEPATKQVSFSEKEIEHFVTTARGTRN